MVQTNDGSVFELKFSLSQFVIIRKSVATLQRNRNASSISNLREIFRNHDLSSKRAGELDYCKYDSYRLLPFPPSSPLPPLRIHRRNIHVHAYTATAASSFSDIVHVRIRFVTSAARPPGIYITAFYARWISCVQ